jgi:hypothetical protein
MVFSPYFIVQHSWVHNFTIMYSVWTSEQTAIISLYSINRLVFITETESVYFEVRTGSIHINQDN